MGESEKRQLDTIAEALEMYAGFAKEQERKKKLLDNIAGSVIVALVLTLAGIVYNQNAYNSNVSTNLQNINESIKEMKSDIKNLEETQRDILIKLPK